jgi:molybdate transport repressor ModE-like protein
MLKYQMFKKLQQVAQSGSMAKASDVLFISHSALVQQVKAAEETLGFPVFERTSKGVRLTPAGKVFLEEGNSILKNYETLHRKCRDLAGHKSPTVTIGTLPGLRPNLLTVLCKKYKEIHPNVNLVFKSVTFQDYLAAFLDGEFDIACNFMLNFAHNRLNKPGFGIILCKPYRFSICVFKTNPLASLTNVTFADLRGKKLMMHARGVSKADDLLRDYLETNEPLIEILDFPYYGHELILKAALENAVLLAIREFAFDSPSVVYIPTDWDFPFERGIIYRKKCNPEVQDFIDMARQIIAEKDL